MPKPKPAPKTKAKIPSPYRRMKEQQPGLMSAYEAFGETCTKAGPLDARTASLVKLAVSLTAGLEGAAHSHCRKAIEGGCSREELLHVAHLVAPTAGFPSMMRARRWVLDVVERPRKKT